MKAHHAFLSLLIPTSLTVQTLQAKECWAGSTLSIERADGTIENVTPQNGSPAVVQLFPGDEASLTYEGYWTWTCPNAYLTLQFNGAYIPELGPWVLSSLHLTEPGYYVPGVSSDGSGDIYWNYGEPFFITLTNPTPVLVNAKAWLDGAYDAQSGLMRDQLRAAGLVPLTNAYGYSTTTTVMAVTGPNAVVDWVYVSLRGSFSQAQNVADKWALIQRDGDIVGMDGVSPLSFNVPAGSYYVIVGHRNHLRAMTASPVLLSSTLTVVDFRSASLITYGTEARRTVGTQRLLWAGKLGAATGYFHHITYTGSNNDRDPILARIGGATPNATVSGYFAEDANLDGVVKYTGSGNDRDVILRAVGGTTPNAVRLEQIP